MQEYWVCGGCKSLNRPSASRCYSCRAPREAVKVATTAAPQPGVALTPGFDDEHREVAWTLMARHDYVQAWQLGRIVAWMLYGVAALAVLEILTEVAATLATGSALPVDPRTAPNSVPLVLGIALGVLGLLTAVLHSVYLGLSDMNVPALSGSSPRFGPLRAGLWWIESALWAIRAGLAFVVPPLLMLASMVFGGVILGLPLGVVWLVCAFWLLGDPVTNLSRPGRLLRDLWDHLAVPGSPSPRRVTYWTAAWGAARGLDYALAAVVYFLVVILLVVGFFGAILGFGVSVGQNQDQAAVAIVLLVYLVVTIQWVADVVALCLLGSVTQELSRMQRVREQWVLSGLDTGGPGSGQPAGGPGTVLGGGPGGREPLP